jgi:hypothetical protein
MSTLSETPHAATFVEFRIGPKSKISLAALAEIRVFTTMIYIVFALSGATQKDAISFKFRSSKIELIAGGHALCGPSNTNAAGVMAVSVSYYEASAAGQIFQLSQARHEICQPEGCPVQLHLFNPDGSRRTILNTHQAIFDEQSSDQELIRLRITRDGRTLLIGPSSFHLSW